jgi:predicted enzyme related to lactoylglutathione lyase
MDTTSVTVGIPVRDLQSVRAWYERVLESSVDAEPTLGIAELEVHPGTWLQLMEDPEERPVLRIGVPDIDAARERLIALGVEVTPIGGIEGVIRFCDFADPEGNPLSLYQVAR